MKTEKHTSYARLLLLCAIVFIIGQEQTFAQFPEDALRFATPGLGVGARALGMGGAYTGIANDYSALYWNPAGLAQLEHAEFSLGLSHLNFKDQGTFLGASQSFSNNATNLNALGLVFPVPATRGSLVFAFGYNRQSNFTTGVSLSRIAASSIAQEFAPDGTLPQRENTGKLAYNLAFELYLADTVNGRWFSPLKDQLTQSEKTLESGGINNYSVGAGVDLAKNVSAGVTLQYQSGSYKFERSYTERDTRNVYSSAIVTDPRNFDNLMIDEFVESDLTGFSAKLGLMFRQPDRFRFGLSAKTPTVYRVKERFAQENNAAFTNTPDHGEIVKLDAIEERGEYDVVTPWVLSGGASVILRELVLSGDIEYTDWTQLEFREANADLLTKNRQIKDLFRATLNYRAGLEYDIKELGVRIRGGFIYNTSPYQDDPSSFDQKFVTGGLGFLMSGDTMLDLTFARGWWKTFRDDYRGLARIDENVSTNNFNLTFSYRF
jgi:long-subunit fatty acid transport protein